MPRLGALLLNRLPALAREPQRETRDCRFSHRSLRVSSTGSAPSAFWFGLREAVLGALGLLISRLSASTAEAALGAEGGASCPPGSSSLPLPEASSLSSESEPLAAPPASAWASRTPEPRAQRAEHGAQSVERSRETKATHAPLASCEQPPRLLRRAGGRVKGRHERPGTVYVPPRSREKLRLPVGCPPRYCAQRAHNAHRRDATRCTAKGEGRCTGTYLSTSHLCVSFARTRASPWPCNSSGSITFSMALRLPSN